MLSSLYICFQFKRTNSDYFCFYFDSNKWNKEVRLISGEGARNHGLLNLSAYDFFNISLFIPNYLEQEKISKFLLLLYKKIELLETKINILKKYKEGFCNSVFLDKEDVGICLNKLLKNNPSTMLTKDIEKNEGNYPVYDATGNVFKYIDYYQQNEDTISIIKYGSGCGRTFIAKGHHSILGTMTDLKPINSEDLLFIYAFTISSLFKKTVKKYIEIGTTPNLYFRDYSNVIVPGSAIIKKDKISKTIKSIEEKEKYLQNQLNHLKSIKKELLNLLFI